MTLEQMKEQLVEWLGEFRFSFDYELKEEERADGCKVIRLRVYTFSNKYGIVASPPGDYLGGVAVARKPRAGEDWTRGNDLADGPFSRETWNKILVDIVAYEAVKIHRQAESDAVEKTLAEPTVALTGR